MNYLKKSISVLLFITTFTATMTVFNAFWFVRISNNIKDIEPVVIERIVEVTPEPTVEPEITPEVIVEPEVKDEPEVEDVSESLGEYRITAYCACEKCCGEWALNRPNGIVYGAAGVELEAGISCASPLPFGTVVEIEGLGEYIVQDRLAQWVVDKHGENLIDIYFDDHEAALGFGLQHRNVYLKGEV